MWLYFLTTHNTVAYPVSGLSGTPEVAQSQVSVGMGLLAGSTVMLLTLAWGTCIIVGKCDLENSMAIDSTDTKGFSLTGLFLCLSFVAPIFYSSVHALP